MNYLTFYGAAVLLALLIASPALDLFGDWKPKRGPWRALLWDLLTSEAGVVVVTYCHPILGAPTITAPTAAQAAQIQELAAQVFFADTDTSAVITHNWGLPNSYPNWLWPQVFFNKSLGGASDSSFATNFTFGLTNTNSVTMTKIGIGTGQGGTYNVYLRRPHSMGQ
jgi:hypothetical protein